MEEGVIYKTTGSWYEIHTTDNKIYKGRLKGKFKIDKSISSTNPIAVGDHVMYTHEEDGDNVVIEKILPRKNYIVRSSPHNHRQEHIIAANLDQALLMVTRSSPRTSLGFIDRFLITSEMYDIPSIIVFNKKDTYTDDDYQEYLHLQSIYQPLGYPCFLISSLDNEIDPELLNLLHNKITLVSGHSGVGKSTFLNDLLPEEELKTSAISDWSGKGMHTTTFAQAFDLPGGGVIIDTPGIKEFGLMNLDKEEVAGYFPEFKAKVGQCAFHNCMHINEPNCAVKKGLENNDGISEERYQSYRSILDTMREKLY